MLCPGDAGAGDVVRLEETDPSVVPAERPTAPASRPLRTSLAAASLIVAAGFLGSRLLGLVRSVAIAHQFGTSPELGAYWVAFRLPDLAFQLIAGATLASAFIPIFARRFQEDERAAWRLANSVITLVFLATLAFAALGAILAPWLVPAMAPGLGDDVGRSRELTSLAVDLTRIMMISPVLFSVSGMAMGVLNARQHFLWPAVAPMVYNLAIIVGALVSDDVRTLAWAVVAGAALHLAVQTPALRAVGLRYRFVADWRDAAVREVGRLMAPRVVGLAAYHFNFVITTFFASVVSDEAISAVNFAWLVMMTPLGLFGMAISTAVFPTLAEQAARDEREMRATLTQALRLILFLTIPSSVGLMLLARPAVAFLFERGAFTAGSTDVVTAALVFYSAGLFAHAGIEILSRGFYALADTRTPVTYAVVSMALNLLFALLFVGPFEVRGLALAVTLATTVEFALLFRALHRRLEGGLDLGRLVYSGLRTVAASVLMAEVVGLYLLALRAAGLSHTERFTDAALALGGGAAIGAAVFFWTAARLKTPEVETLIERVPVLERLVR
ncbi:MAG TPA: murein biosynthesis integral membrane protein MurJ [Dehalococcoidia bacterium]|nr:murein biosynthesis integral membrane protein MurJ [Dehalococcoidia bacterium]